MVNPTCEKLGSTPSMIRELFAYGLRRSAEVGPEHVYDYSLGNPSIPAPQPVQQALLDVLHDTDPIQVHGYSMAGGFDGTRRAVAEDLTHRFGMTIRPEELFFTCGAAAALISVIRALTVSPDSEFVAIAPYFPEYRVFIEGVKGKIKVIPPEPEHFQIDFSAFEQAVTCRTKGVIINSPNNPSGVVYSRQTLETLAAILRAKEALYGHPIYLISDEPYREIAFHGVEVPWVPQIYKDTIVCYSFSKSLSLPGERLGYVLVPKQVTDADSVYAATAGAGRSQGYVNAPSLFQRVAAECCDLTADISVYERNCALLTDALREMGYHVVQPGGAFYLFPRSLEPDDMAFSERAKKFDLLLVPGSGFGAPGHFRIAYCVQTEMIERALPRFKALADFYQ